MKNLFLIFFTLLLVGCASTNFSSERPNDFQLKYYWETGSLPPPYFYSYRILIGPGTQGKIKFQADYSDEDPPIWIEAIKISENDLDQLYQMLYGMGMFEKEWQQEMDIPDGSIARKLSGLAYGEAFSIPSYVDGDQQAKDARMLYEVIEAKVTPRNMG